jgi:hypothetical protein
MKDFQIALEEAAFADCLVDVETKDRGVVTGKFVCVDEFDTDEDRLGYYLSLGGGYGDTVFHDEIVDVRIIPKSDTVRRAVV